MNQGRRKNGFAGCGKEKSAQELKRGKYAPRKRKKRGGRTPKRGGEKERIGVLIV